jgi:hypothetical protein
MGGGISDFAGRARDSVTSMVTPAATQLRDHTDKLVNFIMGDPELPPACIPL